MRSISSSDVSGHAHQDSANKQSGNTKKKHKTHISNEDWKALSMAEKEKIRQGRSQINTIHKRQVAFVGTSEDSEIEETPPNAGTQFIK